MFVVLSPLTLESRFFKTNKPYGYSARHDARFTGSALKRSTTHVFANNKMRILNCVLMSSASFHLKNTHSQSTPVKMPAVQCQARHKPYKSMSKLSMIIRDVFCFDTCPHHIRSIHTNINIGGILAIEFEPLSYGTRWFIIEPFNIANLVLSINVSWI